METHPDPDRAMSDGPNSMPLALMERLLTQLVQLDRVVKASDWLENELKGEKA
jgi:2-dehydro-3-deoxyphosphooctonate aldolase (KDO 8-P synthase)